MKRGGGRRYYRPADVQLLRGIRHLLQTAGYTIKGVQKILREQGADDVKRLAAAPVVKPASARALSIAEVKALREVASVLRRRASSACWRPQANRRRTRTQTRRPRLGRFWLC